MAWRSVIYSGRIATAIGNSSPSVKKLNSRSRPRNVMRENTNAGMLASTSTPIAVATITSVLFRSCRQNAALWSTLV